MTPVPDFPSEPRAYMQRIELDSYYTDGHTLWRVVATHPLGTVDLENADDGSPRIMGISAFRRQLWLAKGAAHA